MLVSVVTVCLNNEKTIEKTLHSIANQSYKNIEHIVVDGCSVDNTMNIVKKFAHIKTIVCEKDNGVYFALNRGLKLSTGEVVGLLHADDYYHNSDVVEKIVKVFADLDVDVVYGDLQYVDINSKVVRYWQAGNFSTKKLFVGWMPPHPTVFFKRKLLDKYGDFDTRYRISADYDWILRIFKQKDIKIAYLPEIIVDMTIGGISNRSLANIFRKMSEDLEIIRKNKVGNFFTLFCKNVRKISQFYRRKNNNL